MADLSVLTCATAAAWEEWLARAHEAEPGIWLKLAKKESGIPSVTYSEALDVALCYGWIDGQKQSLDNAYWLQKFTPRRPRSKWSQVNRDRALALISVGRMQPAGLREVEAARADGRWDAAYESQRAVTVPPDLQEALAASSEAAAFFARLDSRNRYAILHRIGDAKRPETRARRIAKFVAMLAEGRTIY